MKKFFTVATLILLMVGSTTLAFAWWDSLQVQEENITIGIGEGVTLQVALDAETTGVLVPAGVVLQPGQVSSYTLTYDIELDVPVDEALLLTVVESNVQVGGQASLGQFIGFDISLSSTTIQNDVVTATIIITLELTEAIVDAENLDLNDFRNEDIVFDLTFTAEQQ